MPSRREYDYYWTEDDTYPAIRKQALDAAGAPIDLSGGTAVLRIRRTLNNPVADQIAATIEPGTNGWVNATPGTGDIPEPGEYEAQFLVTEGPSQYRVPNDGPMLILVSRGV